MASETSNLQYQALMTQAEENYEKVYLFFSNFNFF
jgi:hypothetical protein